MSYSVKEIPPLLDPKRIKRDLGGPGVTKIYELLRDRKLRAVKIGRSTRVVGQSYVEYMANLPEYGAAP